MCAAVVSKDSTSTPLGVRRQLGTDIAQRVSVSMRRAGLATAAAVMALTGLAVAAPAPASAAEPGTITPCTPSAAHPRPVILIHGTMSMAESWKSLAAKLSDNGYCSYSLTFGTAPGMPMGGVAPIADSAVEVAGFIERVRTATGATTVDLVGHSQGGSIAEYYAKNLGHAATVHSEILLSPVTHGTTMSGLVNLVSQVPLLRDIVNSVVLPLFCGACVDLQTGSNFMRGLNNGPIAQPGVRYAVLASRDDFIATPAGPASFITEPGVTNQYIQDLHPGSVDHIGIVSNPAAIGWVIDQLAAAEHS
ncbi:alpha/beta fold hydrolase [Nocardia sp. SYP-A9097]|uniref:esterase/lipase family protein n=1 Tax=Nocardia sp. SYP-A9097 TaxID=2663237 RepID=UPI00129BE232|nr:alpha/beta fold hydrolase [Nocardia sp. SYP-A9097]MRH89801.1 alpha/beta fold hydrolase [Nocardia sp. SYP-A9097]